MTVSESLTEMDLGRAAFYTGGECGGTGQTGTVALVSVSRNRCGQRHAVPRGSFFVPGPISLFKCTVCMIKMICNGSAALSAFCCIVVHRIAGTVTAVLVSRCRHRSRDIENDQRRVFAASARDMPTPALRVRAHSATHTRSRCQCHHVTQPVSSHRVLLTEGGNPLHHDVPQHISILRIRLPALLRGRHGERRDRDPGPGRS